MTTPQHPTDPATVAEVAPGEGPEPGSVEYGGTGIHSDDVDAAAGGAPGTGGPGTGGPGAAPGTDGPVTTEAGTFDDLPVTADEQVE